MNRCRRARCLSYLPCARDTLSPCTAPGSNCPRSAPQVRKSPCTRRPGSSPSNTRCCRRDTSRPRPLPALSAADTASACIDCRCLVRSVRFADKHIHTCESRCLPSNRKRMRGHGLCSHRKRDTWCMRWLRNTWAGNLNSNKRTKSSGRRSPWSNTHLMNHCMIDSLKKDLHNFVTCRHEDLNPNRKKIPCLYNHRRKDTNHMEHSNCRLRLHWNWCSRKRTVRCRKSSNYPADSTLSQNSCIPNIQQRSSNTLSRTNQLDPNGRQDLYFHSRTSRGMLSKDQWMSMWQRYWNSSKSMLHNNRMDAFQSTLLQTQRRMNIPQKNLHRATENKGGKLNPTHNQVPRWCIHRRNGTIRMDQMKCMWLQNLNSGMMRMNNSNETLFGNIRRKCHYTTHIH